MEATAAVVAAMHGRITVLKRNQTYLAQTNVPSTHSTMSFPFSPSPTTRTIDGGYSHNDDNNNNNRNSSNNAENIPRGMF